MKVKVKDFNPKYDEIEFLITKSQSFGIATLQTFKKAFAEYYVYSYKDFDDTRLTSVVICKPPKRKGVIKWVITYITHIKPMAKKPIL